MTTLIFVGSHGMSESPCKGDIFQKRGIERLRERKQWKHALEGTMLASAISLQKSLQQSNDHYYTNYLWKMVTIL